MNMPKELQHQLIGILKRETDEQKKIIIESFDQMVPYLILYRDEQKLNLKNLKAMSKKLTEISNIQLSVSENRMIRDQLYIAKELELYKHIKQDDNSFNVLLDIMSAAVQESIDALTPASSHINQEVERIVYGIMIGINSLSKSGSDLTISHHKQTKFYKLTHTLLAGLGLKLSSCETAIKKAIQQTTPKF